MSDASMKGQIRFENQTMSERLKLFSQIVYFRYVPALEAHLLEDMFQYLYKT